MSPRPRGPNYRVVCTIVLSLLAVCGSAAAQDKPDFSGRWVLEYASERSPDTPRAMSVRQTVARTNVRGEPMPPYFRDIVIERELESGTRLETFVIGILGGGVSGSGVVGGRPAARWRNSVTWDGNSLVFERATGRDDGCGDVAWTERREVWSLDPEGARLGVAITNRLPGARPATITLVYRRA